MEKQIKNLLSIIKFTPPLIIIIVSILIINILNTQQQKELQEEHKIIEKQFIEDEKIRIKANVSTVYNLIKDEHLNIDIELKKKLKDDVENVYRIMNTIYKRNINKKTNNEIIEEIKIVLRDLRFNNGRTYVSLINSKAIGVLQPLKPKKEGIYVYNLKDSQGKYIIREIISLAESEKAEGYTEYYFSKPSDRNNEYRKLSFIKAFKKLDLIIILGDYIEDYKLDVEKKMLKQFPKLQFKEGGHIFIITFDGDIIYHPSKKVMKTNIFTEEKYKHMNYFFKDLISKEEKDSGTFMSLIPKIVDSIDTKDTKVNYVKRFDDWKWMIGLNFKMSDVNPIIKQRKDILEEKYKNYKSDILFFGIIFTILMLILSYFMSKLLERKFLNYKENLEKQIIENETQNKKLKSQSTLLEEKTNELEKLNKTLEQKVEKRTKSLNKQTNTVTDLLNNAAQGFLSFNKDFLIDGKYSLECEHLLGENLHEKDITELLFFDQLDKKSFFKETIIDVLEEKNELTSSLLLSLLPSEMIIHKRAVLIQYKILSDNKIMMILTNITDKKKLQNKIKTEQITLKMIVSIVSDTLQFYEVKKNFEEFCQDCLLYININHDIKENCNNINALVHTFKGLFAQLYMKETVKTLHHFESKIFKLTHESKNNNDLKEFIESFNLMDCMNKDLEIITQTLGENFLTDHNQIQIDEQLIINLENKIGSFCSVDEKQKKECEEILYEIKKIRYKSLKHYLSIYPKLCQQLCISINKSIYSFEIIGLDEFYISDNYKPFINSLIHVFRNCCDHGIENKEERILLNKNEIGTISCDFKLVNNTLHLQITDDGKGIDITELKKKIVLKKLISDNEIDFLTENEIINFIFDTNFSTMDSITQISGRGIGLASVKIELDKLNGSVEIKTKKNEGTSFLFKLPLANGLNTVNRT